MTRRSDFTLKIVLAGTRPAIWRRVLVPSEITLDRLHAVIQIAMGWHGGSAHYFADPEGRFYSPTGGTDGSVRSSRRIRLGSVLGLAGEKIKYVYDCGEAWEHVVELETVLDASKRLRRAECEAGKGRCPPDDCGGPAGFQQLLRALSTLRRKQSQGLPVPTRPSPYKGWLEGPFDPTLFDPAVVNRALRRAEE